MKELTIGQVIALGAQEEARAPRSEATPPAVPYGQNTVWPGDLGAREEQLEAIIPAILRRLAAVEERLERIEARLLLPEKPSES